jgi:hypothetical protein
MSGGGLRVLYVLGVYHSGTTLLGNVIPRGRVAVGVAQADSSWCAVRLRGTA